jgi:hypothetical protein
MECLESIEATGTLPPARHGLAYLLGEAAWRRLPEAIRARFADSSVAVDYVGTFEVVRASFPGLCLAWLCRLIGTPIVPRCGIAVTAVVHVEPTARGVMWKREYRWPDRSTSWVCSTKVIGADGSLVEELPARLRMLLEVYERSGALHFVSRGYYFDLGPRCARDGSMKLALPRLLSPGTTHVEHIDEGGGWFRFTMTVTHPWLGELFYQTGRFRAAGG